MSVKCSVKNISNARMYLGNFGRLLPGEVKHLIVESEEVFKQYGDALAVRVLGIIHLGDQRPAKMVPEPVVLSPEIISPPPPAVEEVPVTAEKPTITPEVEEEEIPKPDVDETVEEVGTGDSSEVEDVNQEEVKEATKKKRGPKSKTK